MQKKQSPGNPNVRADPLIWAMANSPLEIQRDQATVRAVIATSKVDRAGDVMNLNGIINRKEFLANPIVLWAHRRDLPPVGKCIHLEVSSGQMIATTKFSTSTRFAQDLFELYAEGILRGWSIGFRVHKAVPLHDGKYKQTGWYYDSWELMEYSAVPIPENADALTVAVTKGMVQDPDLRSWLIRDLLAPLYQ
ncbi:MAG: HK97 family phage prohead protease [Zavarzinella sp.]